MRWFVFFHPRPSGRAAAEGTPQRAHWIGPEFHGCIGVWVVFIGMWIVGVHWGVDRGVGVCIGGCAHPCTNDYKPMHTPLYILVNLVRSSGRAAMSG